MNDDKLLLLGCGIFQKEIKYLIQKNKWPLDLFLLDSTLHVDFDALSKSLRSALIENVTRKTIVFYGSCHPLMEKILNDANVSRTAGQNCVEMLLGYDRFTEELSNGAFFLLEDWARKFDIILKKTLGNNEEIWKDIYQGDRKYLACIRTPCSENFQNEAEDAGKKVGLPLKWIDVSLDHLESVLQTLITQQYEKPDNAEEHKNLKIRFGKLAAEKSYLNLLIHMMSKLSAVSGLENMIETMLQTILNNIGGINLMLYYFIDNEIFSTDVFGKKIKLETIEDVMVQKVFESREPVEYEHGFSDTMMTTPEFTKATTLVFPLLVGADIIGVLKIEGIHMGTGALWRYLPTFFSYAALILKNEIMGYSRLQKAFEEVRRINIELTNEIAERKRAEEAVRESAEKYSRFFKTSRDCVYIASSDGHLIDFNDAAVELFGYPSREELMTVNIRDLYADFEERIKHISAITTCGFTKEYPIDLVKKNGAVLHTLVTSASWRDKENNLLGIQGTIRDVTEHKKMQEAILSEKHRFITLAENAPFGIGIIGLDGKLNFINEKFHELFGYSLTDIPDLTNWFQKIFSDPEYRSTVISAWLNDTDGLKNDEKHENVFNIQCADGSEKIIKFIQTLLNSSEYILSCADITEEKLLEKKLEALSTIDELTGLYNRRGFSEIARQQLCEMERLKKEILFFYIDIDNLKTINDTLGHNEGDRAIALTAEVLKEAFRKSDIIGRIGGDEFVVLAIDASNEMINDLVDRLKNSLQNKKNQDFSLSLSKGIARFDPENPATFDELLTQADRQMYIEKSEKKPSQI
jgi:diguanylate cyclase (GGDEF)-like protein/PAS domain S-box-containing protein